MKFQWFCGCGPFEVLLVFSSFTVKSSSPPGISTKRSSSTPNVLDDMFLFGDSGFQPRLLQPQNTKNTPDSKAFHTVPNRLKPASGPKRCPLTAEAFEDPHTNTEGNFKAVQSPTKASGSYHLIGEISPPSPPKVVSPALTEQSNLGAGPQMMKPADKAHPIHSTPPVKQGERSKMRKPVGAYTLVGIPEAPGQMPVLVEPVPMTGPSNQKAGVPAQVIATSEVKGKPGYPVEVKGKPIVESSYALVGQQWQQPGKKVSPPPQSVHPGSVQSASSSSVRPVGSPVEVTGNTAAEPSYEVFGQQWQQPGKKVSPPSPSVQGGIHDVFGRGQGDGESADDITGNKNHVLTNKEVLCVVYD